MPETDTPGAGLADLYRRVEHDWQQEAPTWWRCGRCQMLIQGEDEPSNSRTCFEPVPDAGALPSICAYCDFELPPGTAVERLQEHVLNDCPLHPIAALKAQIAAVTAERDAARAQLAEADALAVLRQQILADRDEEITALRAEVAALRERRDQSAREWATLRGALHWIKARAIAPYEPAVNLYGYAVWATAALDAIERRADQALAAPAGENTRRRFLDELAREDQEMGIYFGEEAAPAEEG